MAKPVMEPAKLEVNVLDIKIIIAVGLCILTSTILNALGIKFHYGQMQLDIIQKATAAISCLLCVQDNVGASKGAGWMRIKVTAMAAIAALVVVSIDSLIGNQWLSVVLLMLGVLLTMFLCKLIKAPYMNCRIGAISYVLIAVTLSSQARIVYALFRVISTVYGVLVVIFVTWLFGLFTKKD
ncbi:MAG: hypothetical protein E7273_02400 [Pseudobutyrivibrio ruminis]|nr:hypothetical protein [Pseudobutyrivibrio ruminis]